MVFVKNLSQLLLHCELNVGRNHDKLWCTGWGVNELVILRDVFYVDCFAISLWNVVLLLKLHGSVSCLSVVYNFIVM